MTYTYDGNGNILTVSQNNVQKLKYTYDSLNQLVREDNAYSNQSYTYAYDVGGNITSKSTYAYTTGELGTSTSTVNYSYGDSSWKDLLTSYDGNTITYDEIGNPLSYNGWTFTWQRGRQLASATKGSNSISYVYNDDGIRTSKTVNGTTTNYFLDSTNKVIGEQNINNTIWYYYDASDNLIGFELNGTPYYYTYNTQGDITAVVNSAGNVVAKYSYDAWGNIISMTDGSGADISSNITHVGYLNPCRYRGYRHDNETGFYYLQSRYYNPQVGRFINADVYIDTEISTMSTNMFAYCENEPINRFDYNGEAYSRTKALKYASQWWNGKWTTGRIFHTRNPSYPNLRTNCANFVSQCLYAGGLSQTKKWYCYGLPFKGKGFKFSDTWVTAPSLCNYLKTIGTYYKITLRNLQKAINVGLFKTGFAYGCPAFMGNTKGVHHAILIGKSTATNVFYFGNTNSRNGYNTKTKYGLKEYLKGRNTYVIVFRMPNGIYGPLPAF